MANTTNAATNGVNTVTPSKPSEQTVAEMADVAKTESYNIAVNVDSFQFCFTYQYAKNWFGIKSEAQINKYRAEWLQDEINKMLSQRMKQIKKQLKAKAILADADKMGLL